MKQKGLTDKRTLSNEFTTLFSPDLLYWKEGHQNLGVATASESLLKTQSIVIMREIPSSHHVLITCSSCQCDTA